MKKQLLFKTKGMNRDLSVSAFNPEFAFENMNLRLSTNESNTMLSWVNERGTLRITDGNNADITLAGYSIGTAVLNHKLVVFTTDNVNPDSSTGNNDYIYVLEYINAAKTQLKFVSYNNHNYLYKGNLNFCTKNPLETLVSYEAENIQKVYWVDGRNQPRVVNLKNDSIKEGIDTQFDFIPTLQLQEEVTVEKLVGSSGVFAPGVIQYAFTYYNKHGQESNIFYTTPLYYISHIDRGGKPDDKIDNAFKITVKKVDKNFDYLRIYSIQRTSINATPICKRIQDISLGTEDIVSFLDTGTAGNTVDPTELLYKGGETITAETIEQKDGTLFFGNIQTVRKENIPSLTSENYVITDVGVDKRKIKPHVVSSNTYVYENQLFASEENGNKGMSCAGFKCSDTYRCGVQFQYKNGKWCHPIWLKDYKVTQRSGYANNTISLPRIEGQLKADITKKVSDLGYVKARAVVVFPTMQDRETILQGVINPTLSSGLLDYSQSSWFFRPLVKINQNGNTHNIPHTNTKGAVAPVSLHSFNSGDGHFIPSTAKIPGFRIGEDVTDLTKITEFPRGTVAKGTSENRVEFMRSMEIQGVYTKDNSFTINNTQWTVHSPDLEFNDEMYSTDFANSTFRRVGEIKIDRTLSDILIETESPTISANASGFIHKSFNENGPYGIVSGLFYDDYLVDDRVGDSNRIAAYPKETTSGKWLIYPWQMTGSLNNDFNRPADKGTQTAKLKKKVISNLRIASTTFETPLDGKGFTSIPQLYSSDEATILKVGNHIYHGNVDTMFSPDAACANYLALDSMQWVGTNVFGDWFWGKNTTSFTSENWVKTTSKSFTAQEGNTLAKYYNDTSTNKNGWKDVNANLGDEFVDLVLKKAGVRMKYKSTPHLIFEALSIDAAVWNVSDDYTLPVIEVCKKSTNMFGGTSTDALKENVWIPCGEPVLLGNKSDGTTVFYYDYGDTYYQRYDCLKTYPFTREDLNQIVEIGSFMLETHVNIDGRYDRNRGQQSNINMSPQNFNLINPVYSQKDNFFTYRILDDEYYKNTVYPNQITWSKTKENGADTDLWTNVTMASVLELDGDKGKVTSIKRLNDKLFCFQDTGISQILYNENVQVATQQGVPIEIANSGKVQGKRYISNTIGCSNKYSIVHTPAGLYFMDSNEKSIYRLGEGLTNVSLQGGFNTWCKQNIPAGSITWAADSFETFVGHYDSKNQDVLFINDKTALAFSEKMNAFTSFYDYGKTPFFCNIDDTSVWIKSDGSLWKHQAGEYGKFFDQNKPYWMTLVGNQEPQMDKLFTNLEFRANVNGDGTLSDSGKFTPILPFNSLETWNEYQHGITTLGNMNGHAAMLHGEDTSALKRTFRIWRCDIPRNNYPLNTYPVRMDGEPDSIYQKRVEAYNLWLQGEHEKGIFRKIRKPQDRMRNPWIYLKLKNDGADTLNRTEIHDVVMTYFT